MPRRPPVALALVGLLALSACAAQPTHSSGNDASVEPVNGLSTSTLIACRGFKLEVPKLIAPGAKQRPTTPLSDTTTAWGAPAITSRCGVRAGSAADDPYTFNDVQWAMHDDGATRRWTTLGRKVNVAIDVPDAYSSQAELIGALAPAVKKYLR